MSSGCESVISVWDLTKPSIEEIPTCQFTAADENVQITHLAWSPVVSKLIASASNFGATLWDVSMNSPLIRKLPWKVRCSCVEWSPRNENLMAVGAYPCDSSAVKVWDLRNMERPMLEFCEGTGGVSGLSWSPYDNDTLVGCTNKKVLKRHLFLNGGSIKEGQVVHEVETCSSCFDVCFAKNMEDCFAVSCSNHIDLYHQVLEI